MKLHISRMAKNKCQISFSIDLNDYQRFQLSRLNHWIKFVMNGPVNWNTCVGVDLFIIRVQEHPDSTQSAFLRKCFCALISFNGIPLKHHDGHYLRAARTHESTSAILKNVWPERIYWKSTFSSSARILQFARKVFQKYVPLWRHDMEAFSALPALCEGVTNTELWFCWFASLQRVRQIVNLSVVYHAMALIWRHCNIFWEAIVGLLSRQWRRATKQHAYYKISTNQVTVWWT